MGLSFVYRKRSESSSSSTKSGHGHGGWNRRGVVLLYSSRVAGNPLPGPPLLIISHSQQWKMGLVRTFDSKEKDRDMETLGALVTLASGRGSVRDEESLGLSPSTGNRDGTEQG